MHNFKRTIDTKAEICKYKNTKNKIHDRNASILCNQQCLSTICKNEISFLEFLILISF